MPDTEIHPFFERVRAMRDIGIDRRCVVIADRRLPAHLLDALADPVLVDAGEAIKTLASIERLAAEVLRRRASRPMTLVAVGGGSVGDAVGFLASILWRGVDLWHVPTTLVAMADSAHGGKTAVNLGEAKNQLGTFHTAARTIIVDECIEMLPIPLRKEGMAEVLKGLWLGDAETVAALTPAQIENCIFAPGAEAAAQLSPLLERAIAVKQSVVRQDPREELGIRTVLNLGHTLGHALELTAGLRHGLAVAWGMAASLYFSGELGMTAEERDRLNAQLFPLLVPLQELPSADTLLDAIRSDKKHTDNALRSVLLRSAGQPIVTTTISPNEWISALREVHREFLAAPVHVRLATQRPVEIRLEAGKSELNRALIIAVQRMGRTRIIGRSEADDVRHLVGALRVLGYPLEDTEDGYIVDNLNQGLDLAASSGIRTVYAGEGGTTFRFLVALSCTSVKTTNIVAAPQLLRRPHEALLRSLRSAGATIEAFDNQSGRGLTVTGWAQQPAMFSVEAEQSSQFATAIALLAVGMEHPFTLRLLSQPGSASYLEMTLRMLNTAGVETIAHGDLIALNQTERLNEALTLEIEQDASSRAVWSAAAALGHPVRTAAAPPVSAQPDMAVDRLLGELRAAVSGECRLDLSRTPDLLPVLAAAAIRLRRRVRFTGLGVLRHKESDRLVAYAASLTAIGAMARAEGDELLIDGRESVIKPGAGIRTHGDHRIVMAAALLAADEAGAVVEQPWSVGKSYPAFWDDARSAGWSMLRPARGGDAA